MQPHVFKAVKTINWSGKKRGISSYKEWFVILRTRSQRAARWLTFIWKMFIFNHVIVFIREFLFNSSLSMILWIMFKYEMPGVCLLLALLVSHMGILLNSWRAMLANQLHGNGHHLSIISALVSDQQEINFSITKTQ